MSDVKEKKEKEVKVKPKKKRVPWDKERLEKYCNDNGVVLLEIPEKITRNTQMRGKCINDGCSNEFYKSFRSLVEFGAYCNVCAIQKGLLKKENTNTLRYGKKHTLQVSEIREKGVQTNMRKRGVKCSLQDPKVREKGKQTNMRKRGVPYASQDPKVKEQIRQTNLRQRGVSCVLQDPKVKEKIEQKNLKKLGVRNPFNSQMIQQKAKNTIKDTYGVDNISQNEDIKLQKQKTTLVNHGVRNPAQSSTVRKRMEKTNFERRGVTNPMQSEDVKQKARDTMTERHGAPYSAQCPDILDKIQKSLFSSREFIFPSGEIRKIQGYEHFALEELVTLYPEDDIITGVQNVPKIIYVTPDKKSHSHFPDIYLEDENMIIEVKSPWTIKKEHVFLKMYSAIEQGYDYEIWEFTPKGEKTIHDQNSDSYLDFLKELDQPVHITVN